MSILDGLPNELIACVLQHYLPDDDVLNQIPRMNKVFNGPHRKPIIDSHTIIETKTTCLGEYNYTKYLFKGKLHKEDGPAIISYRKNRSIYCKIWFINGIRHRIDNPAVIQYYKNGDIEYTEWYINGKLHNSDGPARIHYFNDGNIESKEWCINGKLHKSDGPARIHYFNDGNIKFKDWYINDKIMAYK